MKENIYKLGNGDNNTRYTTNVTISGCTFDVPGAVGIKSYTGGDKNLTITGCTINEGAHSLVQAKGIDNIFIEGCFVYSKNGLNFNNSNNVTVSGCTVDTNGYAVRFGESSGGAGTADYATLTIENTTITGTTDITNTATGATIIK